MRATQHTFSVGIMSGLLYILLISVTERKENTRFFERKINI